MYFDNYNLVFLLVCSNFFLFTFHLVRQQIQFNSKVENIALDRVPEKDELGVGDIVLFPQGDYNAGSTQETGGVRWHQGIITSITKNSHGEKRYNI